MLVPMRTLYWMPRLFATIGFTLLLIGSWLYTRESRFTSRAVHTTGTVVDLDYSRNSDGGGTYHPVVVFRTQRGDTVRFRSSVGTSPPSHKIGERIEVLYDPDNPGAAHTAGFFSNHIGTFVFGLLGVIFGLVGGIWIYVVRRAEQLAEELRHSGKRIEAKVTEVERRLNLQVNGKNPWRIVCQYQDPATQEVYVYRSANLWFDPAEWVKETVPVFVDRNDPKKYHVDLSFLPKVNV